MAKDRLSEFRQKQKNDSVSVNLELDHKANGNNEEGKPKSADLRKTFEQAVVVGQWIESIKTNTEDAKRLISKTDDVAQDHKDLHDRIQALFQNNTTIAQNVSAKLRAISEEVNNLNQESAEGRIKHIQYNSLRIRFQQTLLESNKELENYRSIKKRQIQSQLQAKANIQVSDDELTALLDEGKDIQVFTENIIGETAEAKRILADVEERHQQLQKIEMMITEVRDLFVQMSILVDNQQELIDRVEYQARTATEYVGAVDLGKVRKSKRKYTKRKIYCFLIIIVVLVIVLILIFK